MTPPLVRIEAFAYRATGKTVWVFVRLVDGDGRHGWGEATLTGQEAALAASHTRIAAKLQGSPADPHRDLMKDAGVATGDRAGAAIVSAVDQALWDIAGKRAGRPMNALLEKAGPHAVNLYANINRRTTTRTPEGFAQSATKALADGFSAIKLAPFDGVQPGSDKGVAHGIACAAAVREAIGPARKLMIDCHWRFDEANAAQALDELAKLGLHWFECPLPETPDNYEALRRLRKRANASGVLTAGCEMETGLEGFRPFIEHEIYDVLMPDVKYAGGLAEFRRIAEFAAARNIATAPHNPSGPVCHLASLHVSAGLPGFLTLEHQYDETPNFFAIVAGDVPRPMDGLCPLPAGPGLGIDLVTDGFVPLADFAAGGRA